MSRQSKRGKKAADRLNSSVASEESSLPISLARSSQLSEIKTYSTSQSGDSDDTDDNESVTLLPLKGKRDGDVELSDRTSQQAVSQRKSLTGNLGDTDDIEASPRRRIVSAKC
ncbi:hypothetical protein DFQ30_009067, partial [Apophysomyces sp. BC1015]